MSEKRKIIVTDVLGLAAIVRALPGLLCAAFFVGLVSLPFVGIVLLLRWLL